MHFTNFNFFEQEIIPSRAVGRQNLPELVRTIFSHIRWIAIQIPPTSVPLPTFLPGSPFGYRQYMLSGLELGREFHQSSREFHQSSRKSILTRLVGILTILIFFMQEEHHVVSQKNMDEKMIFGKSRLGWTQISAWCLCISIVILIRSLL